MSQDVYFRRRDGAQAAAAAAVEEGKRRQEEHRDEPDHELVEMSTRSGQRVENEDFVARMTRCRKITWLVQLSSILKFSKCYL